MDFSHVSKLHRRLLTSIFQNLEALKNAWRLQKNEFCTRVVTFPHVRTLLHCTHFSMSIHTLHTPLERGSNCVRHRTTSMWMATCTHHQQQLCQQQLCPCGKHRNMQTLSAVSGQLSAVVHFLYGSRIRPPQKCCRGQRF